ncbi:OTU-domain-containing protein [Xylariomycetidae sp. FL2044]|nr:OTU-domain-containing protein [Xylariomycetidae sp. FL2044]
MRIRYRAPSGPSTLELHDTATVADLLDALKNATGYHDVTVKYGWPPRPIQPDQAGLQVQSLSLHRENLTVEPTESAAAAAAPLAAAPTPSKPSKPATATPTPSKGKNKQDKNFTVPIPETGSWLGLRVMPADNSCLFTAVGGALPPKDPASGPNTPAALRRLIVAHIEAHPEVYTRALLDGKPPLVYCQNMLDPDAWGGAIELRALSEIFGTEIVAVDVKDDFVLRHGEDRGWPARIVLVYSGDHYDRAVELMTPPDDDGGGGQYDNPDVDITRWDVADSDHVIEAARKLARKLKAEHYYMDAAGFVFSCNICGWVGRGERDVIRHATETGHTDTTEIPDTT